MRELLEHLARIAKPDEGAAKILVAISRIATTSCEWLDGWLHVEVDDIVGATEIEVCSDLGGELRELIFPRLLLAVEQSELVEAVKTAPRLVTPLKYRVRGARLAMTSASSGCSSSTWGWPTRSIACAWSIRRRPLARHHRSVLTRAERVETGRRSCPALVNRVTTDLFPPRRKRTHPPRESALPDPPRCAAPYCRAATMAKTEFTSVGQYLAAQPETARGVLERVRSIIREAVPSAEEVIAYQMPTYRLEGHALLHLAGWKHHYSLTRPVKASSQRSRMRSRLRRSTTRGRCAFRTPSRCP